MSLSADDTGRVTVPLMMVEGNMEILLGEDNGGPIECNGVSLTHYGPVGVVLQFTLSAEQRLKAIERGFQFRGVNDAD